VNPLLVLANYFFDSLRLDQFRVDEEGHLEECLIELFKKPRLEHSTPKRLDIRDVTYAKSYRPVAPNHYGKPAWDALLEEYHQNLRSACLLFPVGSLQVLDNLRTLSGDNLVLLSSDRGFSEVRAMVPYQDFPYDTHEGCFSHQVNYHALGSGFATYLHTTHRQLNSVQTVCCVNVGQAPADWPHLRYAFHERLDRSNAVNTAGAEAFGLVADSPDRWTTCLMAFIRMNLFDPNAFTAVAKRLVAAIPKLTLSEKAELVLMLDQIWGHFYQFKGAVKAPFWLGHLYFELGLPEKALFFLEKTRELEGDDDVLTYLRACCQEQMGQPDRARNGFLKALKLNPGFQEAKDALARLA
jgi:tetratricopeptide (TPR) repeat protein